MTSSSTAARISIGTVVRRTGLSAHVLRAWERRYGVVKPKRTDGGLRLYSHDDVLRLQLLKKLTEQGHAIGQVARLSSADLISMLKEEAIETSIASSQAQPTEAGRYVAATIDALQALDGPRIYQTLMRAVVTLKSREFTRDVIAPLLSRVGDMWSEATICPVHEHILSVNLRRVLAWMIDSVPVDEGAPVIVCTTPSHQRHELGAMLAGIAATEEGWRVAYLGPDLPAEDIAIGAKVTGASVVAVSIVYVRDKETVRKEIKSLKSRLPKNVMLVAGGAGTRNAELDKLGAIVLQDADELRSLLRSRYTRTSS
jgi:DNA-binding transcriptional MerR regulator/methylmalonyl-CoA mutase cobalamin-binding subunit